MRTGERPIEWGGGWKGGGEEEERRRKKTGRKFSFAEKVR